MCDAKNWLSDLGRGVDDVTSKYLGVHVVKEGERTEDIAREKAGPTVTVKKPAAEPPKPTDQAVEAAGQKERMLSRLRKGRESTILTGGLSSLGTAGSGKKTLLGQ